MATFPHSPYAIEEFLALDERMFDKRLEFHGGQILELEGATPNHSVLCNTIGFLLRGLYPPASGCQVFDGSVNIYIESAEKVVKPDAAVLCGERQTLTGIDGVGIAIRNPVIVVEVLSKDSENYDKGEKADLYRSLPSLQHYLLISQTKVEVQHYSRLDETKWQLGKLTDFGDAIQLKEVISLGDLYQGLTVDEGMYPGARES